MKKSKAKVISFKYFFHDVIRITGAPLLLWFRPKKIYISEEAKKKIKGGALIMSNHIGFLDPMYINLGIWYRRQRFIATKELFNTKFKRWLFAKAFRCIEIDRDNFSLGSYKTMIESLKHGEVVTIFPEGKINSESGLKAFKSGMSFVALKSGAPIIPVYIQKREHFYSRLVIAVGEPIEIKERTDGKMTTLDELTRITEKVREQEIELEKLCLSKAKHKRR